MNISRNNNKHMKTHSTSLIIRKIKTKTTMRYHYTSTRMAVITQKVYVCENVKKLKPAYIAGRTVKWAATLGKFSSS